MHTFTGGTLIAPGRPGHVVGAGVGADPGIILLLLRLYMYMYAHVSLSLPSSIMKFPARVDLHGADTQKCCIKLSSITLTECAHVGHLASSMFVT